MTLAETLLRQLDDPTLSRDERARLRCRVAEDFEYRGQYQAAQDALGELWRGVGERPALEGLSELTAAEALLRAGTLSGWFGRVRQLEGAQEAAKDLISESIARFQSLGETTRIAAAQSELGLCYRRAGAYDEARVFYNDALQELNDSGEHQLRAGILNRLAVVESASGRYNEALRILTDAARLFEEISDDALRGKFHNDLACVLVHLGKAERRQDYTDRAVIEYTAASYHFERAGHTSYRASAESNLGFLHYLAGRYHEAHQHLNRARSLFLSVKDRGGIAQVDDTRARVLLAQGRTREAERAIREAVGTLEKGDAQALLAEALTTQGRILAKLGDFPESRSALQRAADLAEVAGTIEDAGLALLTLMEEHGYRLTEYELLETYLRADNLLRESQDAETITRLRDCASRIVSARLAAVRPRRSRSLADFWANFNLSERIHAYEARYVQRALIEAEGSVTRAARLLGYPHHGTLQSMLEGRHQDLAHLRTPPERRRRSILRIRAPRNTGQCRTPKATLPITILHVEDHEMIARLIKEALEAEGFSVETCHDGTTALKKISSESHYDLLLFDNELPGVQGLELIRRAREFAHRQHTPMIMLSASPYEVEALRAGADAFLLKTSDANSLLGVINRLLAHRLLGMPEIETARLRLRLFTDDDLNDLTLLLGDPDVMRYLGVEAGQTHSREETRPILGNLIGGWRRRGFGRWAVMHKESGHLIGLCGLRQLDGEIELVYMLAKAYWGRGYAREAARANLRFGFEELGLKRIVAITRPENLASQRVMESIGMRYEREGRYYGVAAICYAIARAEFAAGDAFYALQRN